MASTSHSKQKEGNVVTWHVPAPRQCTAPFHPCHHWILEKFKWDTLDHPLYGPDLGPSDFHLFLHLKKHLVGEKFDNNDEVQEEVMMWFKGKAADFYDSGIQKLVPRLNKCLDNAGDYVEKYRYVQAIHSQCCFCKLKMLYMFKTFVSLLSAHTFYIYFTLNCVIFKHSWIL